jgi:hypothetical protein
MRSLVKANVPVSMIAQVETQLRTKVPKKPTPNLSRVREDRPVEPTRSTVQVPAPDESNSMLLGLDYQGSLEGQFEPMAESSHQYPSSSGAMMPGTVLDDGNAFSWEMIGLGLEEPLPTQEAVDEL